MTLQRFSTLLAVVIRHSIAVLFILPFLSYPILVLELGFPIFQQGVALQLIVALVTVAYIVLVFCDSEYRPRFSPLFISFTAFVFLTGIGVFSGVDSLSSFWGSPNRMDGFVTLLHLLALFLVAGGVFRTFPDWKPFLRVAVCAVFFLVILNEFLDSFSLLVNRGHVTTSLGNIGVYALMLLISLLFTGLLLSVEKNKFVLVFAWIAGLTSLIALVLTFDRAALLGLFAGGVFCVVWFRSYLRRFHVSSFFPLLLAGFVAAAVSIVFFEPYIQTYFPNISKITGFSLWAGSVQGRLIAWEMALRGFLDHPFFGWGLTNYAYVADAYHAPELFDLKYIGTWFHHPHNVYLGILSESGIFAFLAYIGVFISAFYLLLRAEYFRNHRAQAGLIGAFFVAYAVRSFFDFDMPTTSAFIVLVFAMIHGLSLRRAGDSLSRPVFVFPLRHITAGFAIALVFGALFWWTFRPAYASTLIKRCGPVRLAGMSHEACRQAVRIAPFLHRQAVQDMVFRLGVFMPDPRQDRLFAEFAVTFAQNVPRGDLSYSRDRWHVGLIASRFFSLGFPEDYAVIAESGFRDVIALTPGRGEALLNLSKLYLDMGQFEKARDVALELLANHSSVGDVDWNLKRVHVGLRNNPSSGDVHWNLGQAYVGLRDYPSAADHIVQAWTVYGYRSWLDDPRSVTAVSRVLQLGNGDAELIEFLQSRLLELRR